MVFQAQIYKNYGEVLLPDLLEVFNHAMEVGFVTPLDEYSSDYCALKPGKDPTSPDAYRPISKLLAKILAIRLSKYIQKRINCDQSGFIPNRSAANNIRHLFLHLQLTIDNSGNRAILSLDEAKAFDSIEWEFLWNCLKCFGFGLRYI